jgi:hypothetical protein
MTKEAVVRIVPALLAVACGLALSGCLKKATYTPNPNGGYTLHTTTQSLDKAMIRFQRTAEYLCPAGSYALGEPAAAEPMVGDRTATDTTFDVEMTCTPP